MSALPARSRRGFTMQNRSRAAVVATLLTGALLTPITASAHADPDSSAPAVAFPGPGDSHAGPQTGLTFRGVEPDALGGLTVSGSQTGVHSGSVQSLGDDRGAIFTPATPFAAGETVTVHTGVTVSGADGGDFDFTVARPAPGPTTVPDDTGVTPKATPAATCTPRTFTFVSRADLKPPGTCVIANNGGLAPGYLFMTPGGETGVGPAIYDNAGNPIWFKPEASPVVHDFKVIRVRGQAPMLAYYSGPRSTDAGHGAGHYTLLDQHYQPAGTISAGNGFQADFHELLVMPRGTAYVGSYQPVYQTIGSSRRIVFDYVVQEVDYQHGNRVLFEWHSLDHARLRESHVPLPASGPWDYFHGNSIAEDPDGNLLISARNTWTVYKVNKSNGNLIWKLGDPADHSGSFGRSLPGSGLGWFCYQHDARITKYNNTTYYTLYDDGGGGPGCNHAARGMQMTINGTSARLVKGYRYSPDIFTQFTGSTRLQSNGDVVVGWANVPQVTEFRQSGAVALDMRMSALSYRSIREPWVGLPLTAPDLTVQRNGAALTAYVSWNGATEVRRWQLFAGDSTTSMHAVGTYDKTGFETQLTVPPGSAIVQVKALDASGNVLAHGTSQLAAGAKFFTEKSGGAPYNRSDYKMVVGDFGGSGDDDILAYTPNGGPDYLSISDGKGGWSQQKLPPINRNWTPLVGNFTTDAREEIIWWDPVDTTAYFARAPFTSPWWAIKVPAVAHAEVLDHGPRNGDTVNDEILWWGPYARIAQIERFMWPAGHDFDVNRLNVGPLRHEFQPVVGDFDGNGFADVLWYGPGNMPDWVWYLDGPRPGATTTYDSRQVYLNRSGYQPVVGRFGPNDASDDVLFYTPGAGVDWLWRGGSGRRFISTDVTTSDTGTAFDLQRGDNDTVAMWQPDSDVRIWRFDPYAGTRFVQGAGNTILGEDNKPAVGRFSSGASGLYWYAPDTAPERIWQPAV